MPKFPTQKSPGIKNFKPQKIIRSSLSLEIRSTPAGQETVLSVIYMTPYLLHSSCYTCIPALDFQLLWNIQKAEEIIELNANIAERSCNTHIK